MTPAEQCLGLYVAWVIWVLTAWFVIQMITWLVAAICDQRQRRRLAREQVAERARIEWEANVAISRIEAAYQHATVEIRRVRAGR